jgi:hypothetical protein
MKAYFEDGATVSTDEDTLYADLLRRIVLGMADEMLDFNEALSTISIPGLDYRLTVAEQTALSPQQISEGGQADFQKTSWFDVTGSLKKYQTPILITDESKARMQGDIQLQYTIQTAAQGLANAKDTNIFPTLLVTLSRLYQHGTTKLPLTQHRILQPLSVTFWITQPFRHLQSRISSSSIRLLSLGSSQSRCRLVRFSSLSVGG